MVAPSATDMLDAWECGRSQDLVARGLTLLQLACPAEQRNVLATLSIGERDRLLLTLREAAFGSSITSVVSCGHCGQSLELELSAADLRLSTASQTAQSLVLTRADLEIRLRLPDSQDLEATAAAGSVAEGASALLRRCVASARRGSEEVSIEQLPPELIGEAADVLAAADPQADLTLCVTCPACATTRNATFDIVSFLWTELEGWASRILWEVHTLASTYGWSEEEVLSLGPLRRSAYLQRVLA